MNMSNTLRAIDGAVFVLLQILMRLLFQPNYRARHCVAALAVVVVGWLNYVKQPEGQVGLVLLLLAPCIFVSGFFTTKKAIENGFRLSPQFTKRLQSKYADSASIQMVFTRVLCLLAGSLGLAYQLLLGYILLVILLYAYSDVLSTKGALDIYEAA